MGPTAEFKCSVLWSETAAHNHLHKWRLQGFGFSSHLPGILRFLCSDQVSGNVFDIWTPFSGFTALGFSLISSAHFLIWYDFQNLCSCSGKPFPLIYMHDALEPFFKPKVGLINGRATLLTNREEQTTWNVKYTVACSKQDFIHLISLMHLDRHLMRTSVSHDSIVHFT